MKNKLKIKLNLKILVIIFAFSILISPSLLFMNQNEATITTNNLHLSDANEITLINDYTYDYPDTQSEWWGNAEAVLNPSNQMADGFFVSRSAGGYYSNQKSGLLIRFNAYGNVEWFKTTVDSLYTAALVTALPNEKSVMGCYHYNHEYVDFFSYDKNGDSIHNWKYDPIEKVKLVAMKWSNGLWAVGDIETPIKGFFILKMDYTDGSILASNTWNFGVDTNIVGICPDNNGGLYLTGYLVDNFKHQLFIAHTDSSGNIIDSNIISGDQFNVRGVACTYDGNTIYAVSIKQNAPGQDIYNSYVGSFDSNLNLMELALVTSEAKYGAGYYARGEDTSWIYYNYDIKIYNSMLIVSDVIEKDYANTMIHLLDLSLNEIEYYEYMADSPGNSYHDACGKLVLTEYGKIFSVMFCSRVYSDHPFIRMAEYAIARGPEFIEFTYGIDSYPDSLDPHNSWGNDAIDQVVETLFYYDLSDPELKIIQKLADSPGEWITEVIYRVPLKTGISFHDGTPFDADAVIWNYERAINLPSEIYGLYRWPNSDTPIIDTVRKYNGDNYIIEFVLTQPFAAIDALLCHNGFSFISPNSNPEEGELVGTGPFLYGGFIENELTYDEYIFHAYENYQTRGSRRADIDLLTFKVIPSFRNQETYRLDNSELTQALLDGDVDFIKSPQITMLEDLQTDPSITVTEGQGATIFYFGMNNDRIEPYMREAISFAVDYDRIMQEYFPMDTAVRLESPVPLGIRYANWEFNYPTKDLVRARNLLRAIDPTLPPSADDPVNNEAWKLLAADPETAFATYQFSHHWWRPNDYRRGLLNILTESLEQIGVRVEEDEIDWFEFADRVIWNRDLLDFYYTGWGPDYNDPSNYLNNLFGDGEWNGGQVYDPLVTEKMALAMEELNPVIRESIYDEIQRLMVEEVFPSCWLFVPKNYDAYSNTFTGFQWNPMDKVDICSIYPNLIAEIEEIIDGVEELDLPGNSDESLISKLDAAQNSIEMGFTHVAINQLNAFINYVEAIREKKLTNEEADHLIFSVQWLIDFLTNSGS